MERIKVESRFEGEILGYIGITLLTIFISAITIGIGVPWAVCKKQKWLVSKTVIDGRRLVFEGRGSQLFIKYIKWFFFTIITFGIFIFWLEILMKDWVTRHTHIMLDEDFNEVIEK